MTREEAIKLLECSATELVGTMMQTDEQTAVNQIQRYVDAFDMAIAALREQPQWISVEERLPDEGVDVLISRDTVVDVEARFKWGWERDDFHNDWRVTHWMPLPEGPEVEV